MPGERRTRSATRGEDPTGRGRQPLVRRRTRPRARRPAASSAAGTRDPADLRREHDRAPNGEAGEPERRDADRAHRREQPLGREGPQKRDAQAAARQRVEEPVGRRRDEDEREGPRRRRLEVLVTPGCDERERDGEQERVADAAVPERGGVRDPELEPDHVEVGQETRGRPGGEEPSRDGAAAEAGTEGDRDGEVGEGGRHGRSDGREGPRGIAGTVCTARAAGNPESRPPTSAAGVRQDTCPRQARRSGCRGQLRGEPGPARHGWAWPPSSTCTRVFPGPRQTLPAMTRGGSHGYRARLSSDTNTAVDGGGSSGTAAGNPSGVRMMRGCLRASPFGPCGPRRRPRRPPCRFSSCGLLNVFLLSPSPPRRASRRGVDRVGSSGPVQLRGGGLGPRPVTAGEVGAPGSGAAPRIYPNLPARTPFRSTARPATGPLHRGAPWPRPTA